MSLNSILKVFLGSDPLEVSFSLGFSAYSCLGYIEGTFLSLGGEECLILPTKIVNFMNFPECPTKNF